MTRFLTALTGIHSRGEETIQATQDWERSRITSAELRRRFKEDTQRLLHLQVSLDFDFLTDGQMTMAWQDLLRPFTTGVAGIRRGAMVRWFNTNTFYFTPIIEGEIESDGRAVWRSLGPRPSSIGTTKVILPDPLTFVELSEDRHYGKSERLLFAYCDNVLRPEVARLSRAGMKYIQFSAPSLVWRFRRKPISKAELSQVGEGLRSALKGSGVRSGYHTYFGDGSRYVPAIFDLIPTDDVGFDLTETDPSALTGSEKGLLAGVANARSSYVETPAEIVKKLGGVAERFPAVTLAPTCDLQYVPRSIADDKLRSLAVAKSRLEDG